MFKITHFFCLLLILLFFKIMLGFVQLNPGIYNSIMPVNTKNVDVITIDQDTECVMNEIVESISRDVYIRALQTFIAWLFDNEKPINMF